jgi:predicted type IV restriction endonuclease
MLLECLASWSQQFGEKFAEFSEVYGELLLDGVVFPMAEELASVSVRSQRGSSADEIVNSLRERLNSSNPNVVELVEDAETLQKLQSDLQRRVTYCKDETNRRNLLALNDRIVEILRLFDDFRAQGMMQRSGLMLIQRAERQWVRVEEPKPANRPTDEDLDEEDEVAEEREFESIKKRKHIAYASMRQSIVQRFQHFVTRN